MTLISIRQQTSAYVTIRQHGSRGTSRCRHFPDWSSSRMYFASRTVFRCLLLQSKAKCRIFLSREGSLMTFSQERGASPGPALLRRGMVYSNRIVSSMKRATRGATSALLATRQKMGTETLSLVRPGQSRVLFQQHITLPQSRWGGKGHALGRGWRMRTTARMMSALPATRRLMNTVISAFQGAATGGSSIAKFFSWRHSSQCDSLV
jgi:hypothetical protein